MNFEFGDSVTRLRRPLIKAEHGNATTLAEWTDPENPPERLVLPMCAVAPSSATANIDLTRIQSHQAMSLYSPIGVDIHVGDRIETSNGELWEVTGEPKTFVNPFTGWEAGTETPLQLHEG